MCVAIYSPMGNNIPSKNYLKTAWESNPDGAGFAFNTKDGKVQILKGFMTWDAFWSTLKTYSNKYNFYKRGVLIHFRIATHGGVNPECTHPFPLVDDEGYLKKTESIADYAVIHNGRISLTATDTYKLDKMSDTMVFVQKYLSKLASNPRWFYNKANMELIYDLIDSKMAILNGRGEIQSTAGFTKDKDGNYYSNDTYKVPRVRTTYTTTTTANSYSNYSATYAKPYSYDDYYGTYTSSWYYDLMKVNKDDKVVFDSNDLDPVICTGDYPVYMTEDRQFFCLARAWSNNVGATYISGNFQMLFNGNKGTLYRNGEVVKFEGEQKCYYTYIDDAIKNAKALAVVSNTAETTATTTTTEPEDD